MALSWLGAVLRLIRISLPGVLILFQMQSAMAESDSYDAAVATWKSYEDVAKWMDDNFAFDSNRADTASARARQSGPAGLLYRAASSTFRLKKGYCVDAASFAVDALNRVNPAYRAQFVFIRDRELRSPHWVAGFFVNRKIMIMDYGAGLDWWPMKGVHGPYDSLDQYADFLRSLSSRIKSFYPPETVSWRDQPGQQDD